MAGMIGVGMPQWILLNQFGKIVYDAFGDWPYLVGSAAVGKAWRDVDVRLILTDEEYDRQIGKIGRPEIRNSKWSAMCLAFANLGKQMTGLPIDFQIQRMSDANELYPTGDRHCLILCADKWQWDKEESVLDFHPRAAKLMKKRKNFVVVAEDEPYFDQVYYLIKHHEIQLARWSEEDEKEYETTMNRWMAIYRK